MEFRPDGSRQIHFSEFLRLPWQEVEPFRIRSGPLVDYFHSQIITLEQYKEGIEWVAQKNAQTLEEGKKMANLPN